MPVTNEQWPPSSHSRDLKCNSCGLALAAGLPGLAIVNCSA
jgi:hypothetical protein